MAIHKTAADTAKSKRDQNMQLTKQCIKPWRSIVHYRNGSHYSHYSGYIYGCR